MEYLTQQEKKAALFLIITLAVGSALLVFKNNGNNPEIQPKIVRSEEKAAGIIAVDLGGAVFQPGLYYTEGGIHLGELLKKVNLKAEADLSSLNLASLLRDGEKIVIPSKNFPASGGNSRDFSSPEGNSPGSGLLNINEANTSELSGLPGIGGVLAQRIAEYRSTSGPYQKKEDLKMVKGIGEKRYDKVKDLITAP